MHQTTNKNLVSMGSRTEEERKKIGSKGGKKSALVRAEKKALKAELEELLSMNNNQEKICIAIIRKAMAGDVRAFIAIRETIGEKEETAPNLELFKSIMNLTPRIND